MHEDVKLPAYNPSEGVKTQLTEYAELLDSMQGKADGDADEALLQTHTKRMVVINAICDESGMMPEQASVWIFRQLSSGPWADQDGV